MRTTSLAAVLALLIVGCGIDPAPTAPEEPGAPLPEPALPVSEPEFAAATAPANVWSTKAPMPTPRSVLATGVVSGVIYAVGGSSVDGKALATVEAYTPGGNTWATRAPLPSPRTSLSGAGTINGVLYVAGGENSQRSLTTTLFAYNPSTNTWTTKAPMLKAGGCEPPA
jgi:Kelch motif